MEIHLHTMRVKVPEIFLSLKPSACILKRQKDSEVPSSLGVGKTRNLTSSTESQTRKTWSLDSTKSLYPQRLGVLKYEEFQRPKDSES